MNTASGEIKAISIQTDISTQQRPGKWQKAQMVLILGGLSAFAPLSIDMYLPGLPILMHDFTTGASEAQLTLSACLLGLALGQGIAGPLSDALGRRRPLLFGLVAYTLASLLCVISPSIYALIFLRFVQGFAGAAGIVISRAVVRDMYSGIAIARFFSLLMLVNGLAPILAPVLGGLVMQITSWRGVFVALALFGVVLLLATIFGLPETLPSEDRQRGGARATLKTFAQLLTNRSFVGLALASGLAFAGMFAYISGSSFVMQNIYGLSPQMFSIMFGVNAIGIVAAGQINGRIVGRIVPSRLLLGGLIANTAGGIALLLIIASGSIGLIGILPALFVVVASVGFIGPNATTLALSGHPRTAGSASALVGVLQFSIGAAAAPLVGIAGEKTALPMALVIAAFSVSALILFLLLGRQGASLPD